MSKEKIKLTRIKFFLILAVVYFVFLAVSGRAGFVQSGGLFLVIAAFLTIVGIIPFFIGVVLQAVFRKKVIPPYVAWAVAFFMVFVPWLISRRTPVTLPEHDLLSFVISVLIIGVLVDAGIRSFRAFREGRQGAKGPPVEG